LVYEARHEGVITVERFSVLWNKDPWRSLKMFIKICSKDTWKSCKYTWKSLDIYGSPMEIYENSVKICGDPKQDLCRDFVSDLQNGDFLSQKIVSDYPLVF